MFKSWYNSLSNATRAALATFVFTFVATVGIQLMGLLQEVSEWVDGGEQPDWRLYVKVVVSAFIAGASGLVNYVVRYFQQKADPTAGPHY